MYSLLFLLWGFQATYYSVIKAFILYYYACNTEETYSTISRNSEANLQIKKVWEMFYQVLLVVNESGTNGFMNIVMIINRMHTFNKIYRTLYSDIDVFAFAKGLITNMLSILKSGLH